MAYQLCRNSTRVDARDRVKLEVISVLIHQLAFSWDLVLTRETVCSLSQEGDRLSFCFTAILGKKPKSIVSQLFGCHSVAEAGSQMQ